MFNDPPPQKKLLIWRFFFFFFFFFFNFRKSGPISKGFYLKYNNKNKNKNKNKTKQKTADFTIFFRIFCEMRPSSKDFLKKRDPPCLRNFGEKVTHLVDTSSYAVACEYPYDPFSFFVSGYNGSRAKLHHLKHMPIMWLKKIIDG